MSLIPKKGTVYVVDDDEAVRDSLQWLLEGKDYRVRCFDSAESFLSRYDPREVACLIVDIRMGGMTGLELQDRLIERKSPLPIVFITGHGDVPTAVLQVWPAGFRHGGHVKAALRSNELLLVRAQTVVEHRLALEITRVARTAAVALLRGLFSEDVLKATAWKSTAIANAVLTKQSLYELDRSAVGRAVSGGRISAVRRERRRAASEQ